MTKNNIVLTNEQQTLFIPLCGKALDYRSKNFLLNDRMAFEIIEKAKIDLSGYKRTGGKIFAVRAKQYDKWTRDFISQNMDAVVVHLGPGLDARIIRVQPPRSVTWFDVDYREVIDLREAFYLETEAYKMIRASITDAHWLETIPADRPAFVLAEGVFEYLSEAEIKTLLSRLVNHFSRAQIAFDVMNESARTSANKNLKKLSGGMGILKWSVGDLGEVDQLNPKLKRIETVPLVVSEFTKELPWGYRFILTVLNLFPKYRSAMQLVRYGY